MMNSRRDARRFSFAVMGVSWALGVTVCGWLFGAVSFDAMMLATSFVVLTAGAAVSHVVLYRALVSELDETATAA